MSLQEEKRALQAQIDNARRFELKQSILHDNGLIMYDEYKEAVDEVSRLEVNMADLDGAIMLNED